MTLWGKKFTRIPEERRDGQYKHRSHLELCEDLSQAFDQVWLLKWIIGALGTLVSAQGIVSWWLFRHLWDCEKAARNVASLLR